MAAKVKSMVPSQIYLGILVEKDIIKTLDSELMP